MFLGADVTHAPPSEMGEKPSIAAVVASVDAKASQYMTKVSVQPRVQDAKAIEVILSLEENVKSLLKSFYDANKWVFLSCSFSFEFGHFSNTTSLSFQRNLYEMKTLWQSQLPTGMEIPSLRIMSHLR